MDAHRIVCEVCEEHELQGSMSLNMLRGAAMEAEPREGFDDRVVRLVKLQTARNLRYWSPAIMGAAVAGVVLLAALQIISRPQALPQLNSPQSEARLLNSGLPSFPELDIKDTIQPIQ